MSDQRDVSPEDPTGGTPAALSAIDAEALDALIDAGFELRQVEPRLRDRAARAASLLGLLGLGPVSGRDARIARVMERAQGGAIQRDPELMTEDAEALDAWVLAGFDAERVPAALRDRARAHEALAGLVRADHPVSSDAERADLIERTMAGIARAGEVGEEPYSFSSASARNRWADFLSVAAVMLIAASILWPVLSTVRDSARRTACQANMQAVARAMGAYTGEHDDQLPMTTAGFGGGTWWDVGRDPKHSNSANLYTLAREGYVGLEDMACPGNPQAITAPRSPNARDWPSLEKLSYSYRVMARAEKELWGSPSELVIVADRSPVILRAVRRQTIYPVESSPNHRGRGQHGLFADGTARWLESPVLASGDNIWLPKPLEVLIDLAARRQGLEPLEGTEAPAGRQDSFVGP